MTRIVNAKLEGQYITIKKRGNLLPLYSIQNGDITLDGDITIEWIDEDDLKDLINVATIAQNLEKTHFNTQDNSVKVRLKTDLATIEWVEEGLWSAVVSNKELGLEDEELDELVELGQAMLSLFQ